MADRKATNKYYPPSWDPSKGSINQFRGQHPLRDRARKLHQGILIVRFELPYPVWCLGCQEHVGRGVRFNAEKKQVDKYLNIPILAFGMKCHLCGHRWEIRTDPKNTEYVCVSGAKKKVEEWDEKENGTYQLKDEKERELIQKNPLLSLERQTLDQRAGEQENVFLDRLQLQNQRLYQDNFANNRALRDRFRKQKKSLNLQLQKDNKLTERSGLHIPLLPETLQDRVASQSITFQPRDAKVELQKSLAKPLFPKLLQKMSKNSSLDQGQGRGVKVEKSQKLKLEEKLNQRSFTHNDPFLQNSTREESKKLKLDGLATFNKQPNPKDSEKFNLEKKSLVEEYSSSEDE